MNILLWVLQFLLAIHTFIGAIWKFSNSEQTIESLKAIPHEIWLILSIVEIFCSLGLILPVFKRSLGKIIPIAAIFIAAEMLFLSVMLVYSGDANYNPLVYWLVVTVICFFIAYGRIVLKPVRPR